MLNFNTLVTADCRPTQTKGKQTIRILLRYLTYGNKPQYREFSGRPVRIADDLKRIYNFFAVRLTFLGTPKSLGM